MTYSRKLKFEEEPDYDYLKKMFKQGLKDLDKIEDQNKI